MLRKMRFIIKWIKEDTSSKQRIYQIIMTSLNNNIIEKIITMLAKSGLVMVSNCGSFYTKGKDEYLLKNEKIILWEDALKSREAVREIMSIATDMYFDQ